MRHCKSLFTMPLWLSKIVFGLYFRCITVKADLFLRVLLLAVLVIVCHKIKRIFCVFISGSHLWICSDMRLSNRIKWQFRQGRTPRASISLHSHHLIYRPHLHIPTPEYLYNFTEVVIMCFYFLETYFPWFPHLPFFDRNLDKKIFTCYVLFCCSWC